MLSLVLPSYIVHSRASRPDCFHCSFCGPVISSSLNLTASQGWQLLCLSCAILSWIWNCFWTLYHNSDSVQCWNPWESWPGSFPALRLCRCDISKRPEWIWKTNSYKNVNLLSFLIWSPGLQSCSNQYVWGTSCSWMWCWSWLPLAASSYMRFNMYFIPRGITPNHKHIFLKDMLK